MGNATFRQMVANGATNEELAYMLSNSGKLPESYTQREASKPNTYYIGSTYSMYPNSVLDKFKIDNSAEYQNTWKRIADLYNSGDVNGAMALESSLRTGDNANFGGYYDENGNYWGYALGYKGGANGSYQPVLGGKLMGKDLDTTGTDVWLTPDGKALRGTSTLTNSGDTWQQGSKPFDIADYYGSMRDEALKADQDYYAGMGLNAITAGRVLTPYQQALQDYSVPQTGGQYTQTGGLYPQTGGQATQSYAGGYPSAYDPNSDPLWQKYLEQYGDAKAPEWTGGDYNYADNPIYKRYLEQYENAKAPEYAGDPYQARRDALLEAYGEKWGGSEYQKERDAALRRAQDMEWNYDPDTDPVWQAYQKQYRREGQRATEDTLGRLAGMTGGMPSSYAASAAAQAGNYYASQLSDKLPQLYQDAYNRYLQEYQRQLGISDQYAQFDNTEYQRWLNEQGKNLDLADRYYQYGNQDYQRYLDALGQWNTDRNFNYGAAQDAIANGRTDYNTRYQQYLDQLGQFNTDRNFAYGAARDNQQLGRQAVEDQYGRYRDAISDQRYDQEWAQKLREYADEQNWKQTEWEQYLREYGDKLSQQEKEWVYQQSRDAVSDSRYENETAYERALNEAQLGAKYGDYSKLSGMGIDTSGVNPTTYAYASDGSTYDIGSYKGKSFIDSAPTGSTMTGGDGSTWRKDEYGGVTITKNGKVYTVSNGTLEKAWKYADSTNPSLKSWAQQVLGEQYGMTFGPEQTDTGVQSASYNNLAEALDGMVRRGASRNEIFNEIDADLRDKKITEEQAEALRQKYYGQADNVPNSGTHPNGKPKSVTYDQMLYGTRTKRAKDGDYAAEVALEEAYNQGYIHLYEIDMIMNELGL